MSMGSGFMTMRSMSRDSMRGARLRPGTVRRVAGYARPYRARMLGFLLLVVASAMLVVAAPLILQRIVDDGILRGDAGLVVRLALLVAGLAVCEAVLGVWQRRTSALIGEGLIYDLRRQVFGHVLDQPIAFFTRTQTGALVSRLNTDVIGAQQAFTSTLSGVVSNSVSLVLLLVAMAGLSWPLTLASLAMLPLFLVPARLVGRRLAGLTHRSMDLNAELGARMTERFNVAGALLVKLFGSPARERDAYARRAQAVRDVGVQIAMNRQLFLTGLTLIAALATALVYGVGGVWAAQGSMSVGTLLALTALLARLYTPLTALSTVRVDVMTALVSFERVFEVLDLRPLVQDPTHPQPIAPGPPGLELDHVGFAYPGADEVSLASLEATATGDRRGGQEVLHDISLRVAPGQLVALVGPSGAGKTTVTSLVARLYDVTAGAVRVGGVDVRDLALEELHAAVGVVTQEAHLFHDTIAANLNYAAPGATREQMVDALRAAQIWPLVESLPEGLDTIVGDRGHRLSGGEKQRLAIARLLLKAPGLLILDEATAHLDSESEAAVQRALDHALRGRTALVIAHRLATVRGADLIVVLRHGRVAQSGRHEELLAQGGLYADLYRTQFSGDAQGADVRESGAGESGAGASGERSEPAQA